MNQDQQADQAVQAIADWFRHVDQDGYYGGEPGAVHALRDARALYRSVVAPLLAERDAELERWRAGLRRHSWPIVDEVPDGTKYAVELLRAMHDLDLGEPHDRLLGEAAARLKQLTEISGALLADRDRVEASRRDWAAEADRLDTALVAIAEHCEELSAKADVQIGQIAGADLAWAAWGKVAQWLKHARSQDPCARPQCSVHPDRESGEVGHG